ncbi:MAG: carbamoyltransferase HypF, partial [Nitrospirae bacterium]|nr:carbamoyltransferase HypF [Nitrospirota bacterium]
MRLKVRVTGLVQGVGFRPFVHRLALGAGLKGYVFNDMSGVTVEVEGEKGQLDEFLIKIDREKPSVARIYSLQHAFMEDAGFKDFEIRESEERGDKRASVLPDIAVCDDCLNDVINPKDRRFIYPFTNCTNCGPRFTIIQSLPYDRKNTSMKAFQMCPDCENEYNLPDDRRFHAQPDACRKCGPWLSLYDNDAKLLC